VNNFNILAVKEILLWMSGLSNISPPSSMFSIKGWCVLKINVVLQISITLLMSLTKEVNMGGK